MADGNFVYLTRERIVEIEKELKKMKTNGRKDMAEKIAEARSHGDLSENAEYDAAKEEQGLFELKIAKLEDVLSRARVIDTSQFEEGKVHILSKVKIKNLKNNKVFDYLLVFDKLHGAHIIRVQNSIVLIEALPVGKEFERMSEMPLADTNAGIAGLFERLGNGNLAIVQSDAVDAGVGRWIKYNTISEGISPGQNRCP